MDETDKEDLGQGLNGSDSTPLQERSQFTCDECPKVFTHRSSFYKHRSEHLAVHSTSVFIMVRLTNLLLMARRAAGEKPSWQKVNRHYRYVMSRPWTIQAQIANLPGRDRRKVQVEPIRDWKYFKGDLVQLLKGKDAGKQGIINDIIRERNWVVVEGLNCHYRYIGKMTGYDGTYVASEAPLNVRDVALVDPSDNQPAEVDFRFTEAGDKVRVSRRTGRIIPVPQADEHKDFKTRDSYVEQPKDTVAKDVCHKSYQPSLKTVEEELMEANNITETRTPAKTYWY